MNDDFDETSEPQLTADEQALLQEMPTLTDVGPTRRAFLGQTIRAGWGGSAFRQAITLKFESSPPFRNSAARKSMDLMAKA